MRERSVAGPSDEAFGAETSDPLPARADLTREEKVPMLHQWELGLRECPVAEEENMPPAHPRSVTLDEVLAALDVLGATPDERSVPTTYG